LFAGTPEVEEVKEENYDQNNEFGLLLLKVRPISVVSVVAAAHGLHYISRRLPDWSLCETASA
jgi:hypothetical protein